jgi:ATP-dependent Clp protease ATP-binding subunit ClpA
MMDNGMVTGSNGKSADCRNTIIMMTSNLGAHDAERRSIGFTEQDKIPDEKALKNFLAPEFRNRLDGIITFNKLSKDIMIKVVGKFLLELKNQTKSKDIEISVSNQAIDWLVEKGFDPVMGARPLQRVIDKDIKRPLSKLILFGDLKNGGTVHIDVENDALKLTSTIREAIES